MKGATRDLIEGMARKSPSGKVVVLIDDVDAPVTDILHELPVERQRSVMAANQRTLRDFTTAIDHHEAQIRFLMYTGVTTMASAIIPGHIYDLTFDEEIGSRLCGYTKEEIHANFHDGLMALHHRTKLPLEELNEQIADWYGGYSWGAEHGRKLHNPYAINYLMATQQFGPHWSTAIGPLLWLSDALVDCNLENALQGSVPLHTRSLVSSWSDFSEKNVPDEMMIRMLLLNLGLLTIENVEVDPKTLTRMGVVGVPNQDVKEYAVRPLLDSLYLGHVP